MAKLNSILLLGAGIALALGSAGTLANVSAADDKMSAQTQSGPITNARQEAQIWTTYALSPYLRANNLSVSVQDGKACRKIAT
ncbi:MAG: hypothetical protein KKE94_09730 [Gammaproteobacteria bacterium]|nr:hypothetical protein [Gammaproteobacteria bacterium]